MGVLVTDTRIKPRVTVLMPVYNGQKYLGTAIQSILEQTFADFELLIINDGSTDQSRRIVESYDDPRIRLVNNESNLGLTRTLNKGLDLAQGQYIARMDCDDIAYPDRFVQQVNYMETNSDVVVCGGWVHIVDQSGATVGELRKPYGDMLRSEYWRPSPIIHPTAMIRRSHLGDLRYDTAVRFSEDYDLWFRLRERGKIDNVPMFMLKYRVHDATVTAQHRKEQLAETYQVFMQHTGIGFVSYDEFLTLIGCVYTINPVRRWLLSFKVAGAVNGRYVHLLKDDLSYAKRWLRNVIHGN